MNERTGQVIRNLFQAYSAVVLPSMALYGILFLAGAISQSPFPLLPSQFFAGIGILTGYMLTTLVPVYLSRFMWLNDGPKDYAFNAALTALFWPIAILFWLVMVLLRWADSTTLKPRRFLSDSFWIAMFGMGTWLDTQIERVFSKRVGKDEFGELWLVPKPHSGERYLELRVQDSTGSYKIRVPPYYHQPKDAVAWTYQLNSADLERSTRF